MAAQPTPSQTPTNTTPTSFPTLRAAQARAVLQWLLSAIPNPPAPRATPNTTTPKNAPNPSSPPSKDQLPSSLPTITIDASTRISGHGNKIHLSPHNVHEEVMSAAVAHTSTSHRSTKPVNLRIQTGINLMGSRNIVGFCAGFDDDAASKDLSKAHGGMETVVAERVCEEGATGRKRRAESEPVGEARGKKVKV